jgi:lipoprotein-anchoring transpeptidase ErfK/SrfK
MSSHTKQVQLRFNDLGEGVLDCKGFKRFRCLGKKGLRYPTDITINPRKPGTKSAPYYSRTYSCVPYDNAAGQCTMNYAVLIWGQQGVFIHEWPTPATYAGNNGPTHGCIHLDRGNARLFYDWVDGPTRLRIEYRW